MGRYSVLNKPVGTTVTVLVDERDMTLWVVEPRLGLAVGRGAGK